MKPVAAYKVVLFLAFTLIIVLVSVSPSHALFTVDNSWYSQPRGIAIDKAGGFVYVADATKNRVRKYDLNGTFLSQWGTPGTGNGQFSSPWGITVDNSGNVYVVDSGNNRIQKFSSTGSYITQWGSSGTGNGQFNDPRGIAVSADGNVYVADFSNRRIQKFNSAGVYLTQWSHVPVKIRAHRTRLLNSPPIGGLALPTSGRARSCAAI